MRVVGDTGFSSDARPAHDALTVAGDAGVAWLTWAHIAKCDGPRWGGAGAVWPVRLGGEESDRAGTA